MAYQTSYSERIAPPTPGTIAGNMNNARVSTGIAETAAPGIGFGLAVSQGASSDEGVILGGTVTGLRGCSVKNIAIKAGQDDKFLPPDGLDVLESGDIWVAPGEAVLVNDPVFFHGTTGVWYKQAGAGRVGPVLGAKFKTACGVGGASILELPTYNQ